jgi:hypothetical protein
VTQINETEMRNAELACSALAIECAEIMGTCRVLLFTSDTSEPETPEGPKASPRQVMGTYHDPYVRTQNSWRFPERRGGISLHS